MITNARSIGGLSGSSEPIRFEISTAEDLGKDLTEPIPDGSVDLITAATAAHWFDMTGFWPRAAQVLKPGGTVALWTSGSLTVDPDMPNATAIQAALDKFLQRLRDYSVGGNRHAADLYIDLPLPWTLESAVTEFDATTFVRKEWNTPNATEPGLSFFAEQRRPVGLDTIEKMMGTMSPVTRWREAHPDAVGTEQDIVRVLRREMESALLESGAKTDEEMKLRGRASAVLLMVKKKGQS
jgi:hypothetical protein